MGMAIGAVARLAIGRKVPRRICLSLWVVQICPTIVLKVLQKQSSALMGITRNDRIATNTIPARQSQMWGVRLDESVLYS